MGVRDRAFQPTTNSTSDLVIGLMKMSVGASADYASAVDYNTGEDPDLTTLGAVQSASLAMTPTFKEHQSGYPQILDFKIAELLQATYTAEIEEVNDVEVLALIDEAIDSLETGSPKYYAIESLAEFATGGTLSLFSPYAQLKPSLNFSFADDFASAPFEFEALSNPAFTASDLVYRTRVNAGARSLDNQPMTKNVANLAIGMFQVRIGQPSRRIAGTSSIGSARQVVKGATTETAATASGTYDGSVDGNFLIEVTDNTGDNVTASVWYPGTDQAGAADDAAVSFTSAGTPVLLAAGVSVALASVATADNSVGDKYVVSAYTADAVNSLATGIQSEYSFLSTADSVGAINAASLETNPTYKEHQSGYPMVRDLLMLESSTVTISTAIEEINAATTDITKGYAVNLFDILFDASINGMLYNVPVEIVAELVTGGTLSFWFPNCQITPEGEFAPSNEWASMPFSLEAQIQGASSSVKRLYRQSFVQNI